MIADIIDQIFGVFGQLILAGGGGAAIAWILFKKFGENWISHQFAKDLEAAKAEISLLVARRMRLHDKEYEVFPEIWSRLVNASNRLSASIISLKEMPDFSKMSDEDIGEWVERSDLTGEEKSFFLGEGDKIKALDRIIDIRGIRDAGLSYYEFREYLQNNRIFLHPEIKDKFDRIESLLRKSWAARKTDFNHRGETGKTDFLMKAFDTFEKEVRPLMNEIESLVQAKLFPESEAVSVTDEEK